MGLQTNKHSWGTSQCRYQPSFSPYQTGALVRERKVSEHNSNTVWIYGDNNIYPLVICYSVLLKMAIYSWFTQLQNGDLPLKIFPLKIVIFPLNIVIFPLKMVDLSSSLCKRFPDGVEGIVNQPAGEIQCETKASFGMKFAFSKWLRCNHVGYTWLYYSTLGQNN